MEQAGVREEKTFYLSVLNVAACIGVIILHCNGVFWAFPKGSLWVTSNLLETLFYWPVPVFFMLTGATLIDYRERYSTKEFFIKRIKKTAIPFVFWSLVAMVYWTYTVNGGVFALDLKQIVTSIINTTYVDIYWFFIPLFAIYLSIPIVSGIRDKVSVFRYAVAAALIFISVLPQLCGVFGIVFNPDITPPAVSGYMMFPFLGYLLAKRDFTKKERLLVYALGVVGWAAQFFGTAWLSAGQETINTTFKGYTNLPSVLQAAAVFVFFKYLGLSEITAKHPKIKSAVNTLSGLTFGIYLIHVYIVYQAPVLLGFNSASLVWRTLGALGVFAVCAAMVWLLKKLPLIKNLVP